MNLQQAEQELKKYPKMVQVCVSLVDVPYVGYCKKSGYGYEVTTANFYHEMGHALAKLLGIEKQLGEMMMDLPNAKSVTNENWLCYPAQHLAGQHFVDSSYASPYDEAVSEYAAEAIRNFVENDGDKLPENIKSFIQRNWQ